MKTKCLMVVLIALIIASCSSSVFAGNKIFISRILAADSTLTMNANAQIPTQFSMAGFEVVTDKKNAQYEIQANITGDSNRTFNFWILLVWFWPIVPFTNQQADVSVTLNVVNVNTGDQVCTVSGYGKEKTGLLGDFASSDDLLKKALNKAIAGAMAQLPASLKY